MMLDIILYIRIMLAYVLSKLAYTSIKGGKELNVSRELTCK